MLDHCPIAVFYKYSQLGILSISTQWRWHLAIHMNGTFCTWLGVMCHDINFKQVLCVESVLCICISVCVHGLICTHSCLRMSLGCFIIEESIDNVNMLKLTSVDNCSTEVRFCQLLQYRKHHEYSLEIIILCACQ